jgi:nucleotide-binding universal stress UspA family protein
MFGKVLVALDSSQHRSKTLRAATELAKVSESEVEVLHVRESHFIGRAGAIPDEEQAEASKVVNEAVEALTKEGVKATGKVRGALHGRVATEILDEARESEAAIIVMGSHGAGELEGLLLGSTTHKILHLAKLPVLVAR